MEEQNQPETNQAFPVARSEPAQTSDSPVAPAEAAPGAVETPVETPVARAPQEPEPAQPPVPSLPLQSAVQPAVDFRVKMREGKIKKIEKRLEKILELARQKGKITNNDIQKFLRISDATVTRYAQELVKRNLLKKSGKIRGAYYEPT